MILNVAVQCCWCWCTYRGFALRLSFWHGLGGRKGGEAKWLQLVVLPNNQNSFCAFKTFLNILKLPGCPNCLPGCGPASWYMSCCCITRDFLQSFHSRSANGRTMPMALLARENSTVTLPDHLSCREVDVTIRGGNKGVRKLLSVQC